MNINSIKVINNYKNYNYLYKGLKGLALYKNDFITLLSPFKELYLYLVSISYQRVKLLIKLKRN
ncbi:hypothetical protein C8035_v003164 [Colletotrichum spinosum]|uniref:Uncharacterized protein n=1 Tax=Colletotrichum spinosum TaxID=1347390 RepID=A0A4R8PQS8_9PEZI|nr:hypothetical protein C8035_v003164 [Colletotrichum spinosum]